MTTVGQVLDEFFSPRSAEELWIMPESDEYTVLVRQWQPVIDATMRTKQNLMSHCAHWGSHYGTSSSWKPTKTDAPKAGAYREFVPSPPGTDPDTRRNAFVIYATSKAAGFIPVPIPVPLPEIQTRNLYTCSIGSFNIYTTVDRIDCTAKAATLNYWMYNAMSRRSFGNFATHPHFV